MLQSKKAVTLTVFLITGLLFLTNPIFADSSMENCDLNSFNKTELTKEQVNKIENIEDRFEKNIIPIHQKINTLRTEAYNYTLNQNVDVDKIKNFREQIRITRGEIEDKRLDMIAEINNILPEDQREDFGNYFSKCEGKTGMMVSHKMMQGKGMMNEGGMMKTCMRMMENMHGKGGMMDEMHDEDGMINGSGMMNGNMMNHDKQDNTNASKSIKKSEHEQHHK